MATIGLSQKLNTREIENCSGQEIIISYFYTHDGRYQLHLPMPSSFVSTKSIFKNIRFSWIFKDASTRYRLGKLEGFAITYILKSFHG